MLTKEVQERLLAILDATPDLVAINDMHGRLCYLNQAGRQMLGIGENEQLRGPDGEAETKGQESEAAQLLDDLFPIGLKEGAWQAERALRTRDGRRIPVSQVVLAHKDADGHVVYFSTIARDMSEHKALDAQVQEQMWLVQEYSRQLEAQKAQLEEANQRLAEANLRLEALAVTDGLTGLKNHRAFQDRLTEEFARSRRYAHPMSVLLLDVDHFKQYNDTFGHPAGDQILKRVADMLQMSARATDFVARYGGEEFAVILPETNADSAQEAAERIRAAIASHRGLGGLTVSTGIASLHVATESPAALVEEADKALYISKSLGRNRITHHDGLEGVVI